GGDSAERVAGLRSSRSRAFLARSHVHHERGFCRWDRSSSRRRPAAAAPAPPGCGRAAQRTRLASRGKVPHAPARLQHTLQHGARRCRDRGKGPHSSLCGAASWKLGAPDAAKSQLDRKSTRLNSSHVKISYAVFCLKKKI